MWIVRLALRRPFTVAALCLAILLMGVLSAASMPVDIFPTIDIPVVVVVWNYPGMSAEDMERRVTLVSERGYSTAVNGIARIDSQSITGISVIRVYFEPDADIGSAIAQISAASLSASRVMPPGMQPPVVLRYNASNVPVAQLTLSGKRSEQELFDYGANFLRLRLFTIPGLSTPAPYGGKQRQVEVDVDPGRVAAKGLSAQDVVNAVLAENVILPAGSARMGNTDYNVLLNGSPPTTEDFNGLPVKVVNGATIYLGDVAHVHDGFAVQQNLVRVNGQRATYLSVLKKENASTLAVVDATRDMLPALKAAAPEGMELKLEFDQSKFVRGAVWGVVREAGIAAALVAIMTLAFIGSWRSTVIVCVSIPLAILVSVVGLKLSGQTLNLMTMGGLSLAIGMLVDDATVEIENINRNRGLGKDLLRAILDGARQIALPALAATTTICIVFFPVVLLSGPAKFLFVPLALSVAFAMMASYLLSRTLVPTLASMLLGKERPEASEDHEEEGGGEGAPKEAAAHPSSESPPEPRAAWREKLDTIRLGAFRGLRDRYTRVLRALVGRRRFVLAAAGLFAVASGALLTVVGLDFFPSVDAGILRLHYRAPPGTRIEQTERLVDDVERRVREVIPAEELATVDDNVGVPISYNLGFLASDNVDGADAEILVALAEKHHDARSYAARIRESVRRDMPGSTLYFQQADVIGQVLNFGLSAPIDVQVESQRLEDAVPVALRLENELRRIPGTEDVRLAQVLDHPALRVDVDRPRAAQLGLTERDVASSLLTSLSSSSLSAPSFWVNPKNNVSYFVVVQTPIERIRDVAELMATPVTAAGGTGGGAGAGGAGGGGIVAGASTNDLAFAQPSRLPPPTTSPVAPYVGGMARLRETATRSVVNHVTVQPVLDVQCNVEGRDLGAVASDIDRAVKGLGALPKGTSIHVRGQSDTMRQAFTRLGLGMLVAIALVYLLLVVLFQSWLDPLIILLAVPGALSGILWFLVVTGTTLNVESFMGAIMSIGIATSNSILLVHFANELRMTKKDVTPEEAAVAAGRTRLRPVLMTALAMLLGMLPMALGLGEGGEQNAPLGRAVIGGLLVATPVTLLVVPCAYAILRRRAPSERARDRAVREADVGEEETDDAPDPRGPVPGSREAHA